MLPFAAAKLISAWSIFAKWRRYGVDIAHVAKMLAGLVRVQVAKTPEGAVSKASLTKRA